MSELSKEFGMAANPEMCESCRLRMYPNAPIVSPLVIAANVETVDSPEDISEHIDECTCPTTADGPETSPAVIEKPVSELKQIINDLLESFNIQITLISKYDTELEQDLRVVKSIIEQRANLNSDTIQKNIWNGKFFPKRG